MVNKNTRFLAPVLVATALLGPAQGDDVRAAELESKTIAAFDKYVLATERRLNATDQPFLRVDGLPMVEQQKALESLKKGELVIESLETRDNGRTIKVDDALVHHWLGVVFVPGATVQDAVTLLQDYNHHQDIYKPNVQRSKLLSRDGDHFKVYLRFFMKKGVTVVVNSDHDAQFTRDGPDRASSRIRSTRIAQVDDPDTSSEKERPVGNDDGYLWRLNSYWRFLARDGGVYIQCESITLTRGIPFGLGWLVGPFVTSIPRETLSFTLEKTRTTLKERRPGNGRGAGA